MEGSRLYSSFLGKLLIISTLLLASCRMDYDKLKALPLEGKDFYISLAREYRAFSERKAELGGWMDAEHFATKGLQASRGEKVEPEKIEDWNIPTKERETLRKAREDLLKIVTENTISLMPEASARAYAFYDCWVEELEDGWRVEWIDYCRSEFYKIHDYLQRSGSAIAGKKIISFNKIENRKKTAPAIAALPEKQPVTKATTKAASKQPLNPAELPAEKKAEPVVTPPASAKASVEPTTVTPLRAPERIMLVKAASRAPDVKALPRQSTILFAENSAKLPEAVQTQLREYGASLAATEQRIVLNGHTDKSEKEQNDLILSRQRAEVIRSLLIEKGVDKARIEIYGFGHSDPAKAPAKQRAVAENRRVEIIID